MTVCEDLRVCRDCMATPDAILTVVSPNNYNAARCSPSAFRPVSLHFLCTIMSQWPVWARLWSRTTLGSSCWKGLCSRSALPPLPSLPVSLPRVFHSLISIS